MANDNDTTSTGVYCWRNSVNGKVYVGSASVSFKQRKRNHLKGLRKGKSPHQHFQRAWSKYGEASFEWIEVERCPPNKCVEREQCWIDCLRAADEDYGYNAYPTAGSPLGFKQSDEHKAKISAGVSAALLDPELRLERSEQMKVVQSDLSFRAKRVAKLKATLATPEVREARLKQLDQARTNTESKAKKSASIKKSWDDPEVRRKRSEAIKKSWERRRARK